MRIYAIFFISIFFLSNCSEQQGERQQLTGPQGTLRLEINGRINQIFPLDADEFHAVQITEYMLSPSLLEYTSGFEPQAMLASDWEIADDRQSVLFTLDGTIKWSNGRNLTARDVLFSWDVIRHLPENSRLRKRLQFIDNIVVPDSLTVRVKFKGRVADPLLCSKMPILPVVWSKIPAEKMAESYYSNFIGCGPFVLLKMTNDSLVLKANPYATRLKPNIETVVIYFADSPEVMVDALRGQKVDMAVDIPIANASEFSHHSVYNLKTYPERGYTILAWNLENPFLKNLDFRRALSMAIDRETLADGVLAGFSTVVGGPFYPSVPFEPIPATLPFDQPGAEQLLATLGWTRTTNSSVLQKNGQPLQLDLLINRENPVRHDLAVNIKANLEHIGVTVTINEVNWQDYLLSIRSKKFDAALLTWVDNDRYDPSELFHSGNNNKTLNIMSYNNPLADIFLEQGLNEISAKKREAAWAAFQKILAADLPVTFLFNQKILTVINKNIENVNLDGRGYLAGVKDWQIKIR